MNGFMILLMVVLNYLVVDMWYKEELEEARGEQNER